MKTRINEIFSSIQGEGPVVGYKQLFIRFCGCNLNCNYCDTEFQSGKEYTPIELAKKITSEYDLKTFHSISLTGGEPLLSVEFLKNFLPIIHNKIKIYLETNATLPDNLNQIKKYIDIISADIKLESASGKNTFKENAEFFEQCHGIYTFAKIVFDENITEEEIKNCANLGKQYNIELILQPKTDANDKILLSADFCNSMLNKFTAVYTNVRLIPQVHKLLNIR